jgi:hypothetical protein
VAALTAAAAGCGGGGVAPSAGLPAGSLQSTPQPSAAAPKRARVMLATPQRAVQSYIEGIQAANGSALCNVLDRSMQRALIEKLVQARPTEAGASCAQALTGLAASVTSPGEQRLRLPPLHVKTRGATAVVTYRGPRSHEPRSFTLVKRGRGWLIDKINGTG